MPKKKDEMLRLARAADDAGHSASAFEFFQRVVELDPKRDSAIYRAVKNLIEIGRISDAEVFFNKIRRNAAPKPWLIEKVLGDLRIAQFRPVEAEQHFRNAWKLNPGSTAPAVFLADCLIKREKFNEAYSVLIEALKAEGHLEEVYLNLGFVSRATGDYESARNYLLKALEIDPDYPSAKRVLADIEFWLSSQKKYDGDL